MKISEYLTSLFGSDIRSRINKLCEEVTELREAHADEEIAEELADVQLVVYHIATLQGLTTNDLIISALEKVRMRESDQAYQRHHEHIDRCCGNCQHFMNEDIIGWGTCEANNDKPTTCAEMCVQWEKRKQ